MMKRVSSLVFCAVVFLQSACGQDALSNDPGNSPVGETGLTGSSAATGSTSEVSTSLVSGAVNNTQGSGLAFNQRRVPVRRGWQNFLEVINPIGTAHAASWQCSGGSLSPTFDGDGSYAYTPVSCSASWDNGKSASSEWSGAFTLTYAGSCDTTHPWIERQADGCSVDRTTPTGGLTRTITGPDGNAYAITHDTNGAGTGWDSAVSPSPSNDGLSVACGQGGCESSRTITIAGSHLTGAVTPAGGKASTIWNHTLSTGATPLTLTGSGSSRTVNGTVTVQHNLAKYTATSTFSNVVFGEVGCCFPTGGTVSTTFTSGPDKSKTETLTFSTTCGAATLTLADGTQDALTLKHCI